MRIAPTVILPSALSLASACATTPPPKNGPGETAGRYVDDAAMTASVNAIIVGDADARYFKIDVSTTSQEVTLRGTINSAAAEARLLEKIRAMQGVRSVTSMLRIEPAPS